MSEEELRRDRSRAARAPRATGIARHGRLPRSNAWKTAFGVIGSALAVALVATTSVAAIAVHQFSSELGENAVVINETSVPIPEIGAYEGGFNMLVVGSDAYYDRDSTLNDVNILIHVSADQTSATAVSIPRDLVVPFPPCTNPETGTSTSAASGLPINNALSYGGLKCVVDVVELLTGLEIQYAGMIGFGGVIAMSDAVGGVEVCVASDIDDSYVGLHLKAGYRTLKGATALKFLRSRHGVGDGSDLTRISSQQVYLSALLRKLKSDDTLTDVGKLISLTQAAAKNMSLSEELTQPATIIAMAKALNNIPMDRITFVQYPGTTGVGGIYTGKVAPIQATADALFAAIKADKAVGVEEAGDGRGSVADPNATPEPSETPSSDPSASADPSASPTKTSEASELVTIPNLRGQTAADQTCTIGN
ncbi:LCP family protein [Homoserinibacter sp. GY 40078]|uniref:LCP family protein n=1 Tax=Homoserinibacter sp. GY 40078 TaxID=2603275 RepID=UPI0011CA92EB|nr:LCP family protein [Homoserinibacter sp. GY 40078]TXK18685.1 LytR family transcriptional regulator [Homoserinibacter sp. GY 40078]